MPDDSPTIYDFPFMQDEDAQAQARAMAQALRRQQMQGLAVQALTGGQRAGPMVGQGLTHQAGVEQGLGAKLLDTLMQEKAARARLREQEASQGRLFTQQKELEGLRAEAQARAQEAADRRQAAALAASEQRARFAAEEAYKRAVDLTKLKGETKPDKPLTESQGQAAMFLKQGENALTQAMQMGPGIFPTPGVGGGLESLAWKARIAGFPQLSSSEQQARQGLLLSIAEPIIRAESGAAVPESEVRRLATRYIPMPGESAQEHQRKLKLLVNAIEAVSQKLPEAKAAEFRPFYEKAAAWAASYGGKQSQPSAPTEKPKSRKRYNPQTGEFE